MRQSQPKWTKFLLFAVVIFLLNPAISLANSFGKVSIDTGLFYSLALRDDGKIWAWGRGGFNTNQASFCYTPTQLDSLTEIIALSQGNEISIALKSDGTVWTWGWNSLGGLGDGTTCDRLIPCPISGLSNVVAVSAGYYHSLFLKSDGTVWASGRTGNTPGQVIGLNNVIAISAGYDHSIALKSDGTVWAWGYNAYGQLGDGSTSNRYSPIQVSNLTNVVAISGGYSHSMALKSDGTVWAWGSNSDGVLGDGTSLNRCTPVRVQGLTNVTTISAGWGQSIAVRSDGTVWAWGNNSFGVLGDGTSNPHNTPVQVNNLTNVIAVSAGENYSMALKSDGTIWAWGNNNNGQLGIGGISPAMAPTEVANLNLITQQPSPTLAAGYGYTAILKDDGTIWSWGSNIHGKLGDGTTVTNRTFPVQSGSDRNWLTLSSLWEHTAALKTDGSLWAWGSNTYGQLGDNSAIDRTSPVRIGTDTDWQMVASGYQHTVALKTDGSLWAWGSNQYGQLGDGTYFNRLTPVRIGTATDWAVVTAGSFHTIAMKQDGSLWAWGDNRYNQLGDGTTTSKIVPTRIGTATDWAMISAAAGHTLAVKNDGTLWGWGHQTYGELGDGTTISRAVPTQIGTDSDWARVEAIWNHTAALKTDSSLWTWGSNYYGQLGIGTNRDSLVPVRVGTANDWVEVTGGDAHTIAKKQDGSIWVCGLNNFGQLGLGNLQNHNTFVRLFGNAAPVAVNDTATVDEDASILINVVANDSDADGDALTVFAFTQGAHGMVTQNGNSLSYLPATNYFGSDSFTYQIIDGQGGTATATVNVTITAINDVPKAQNDTATLNEDETVLINVLENDSDIESDKLSITGFTQGSHGVVSQEGTSLRYTPMANYNGTDSFTYQLSDTNGGISIGTVNITIWPSPTLPIANNDVATLNEDDTVLINVLANDSDVDGDGLTVTSFTQGTHGTVALTGNCLRYTPCANYYGADSFTYQISDGKGGTATATVDITVESVNDFPMAVNDAAAVNEDGNVLIDVIANDIDVDGDSLTITAFTQGAHGTVTQIGNGLHYTPIANYFGADSFTYQISDGKGGTATATVNVTVIAVNDPPIANTDSATVNQDETCLINVLGNDTDIEGDTLIITSVTQGSHGMVSIEGNSIRYTPDAGYSGPDSFTYTISDGHGGIGTALVNISVNPTPSLVLISSDFAGGNYSTGKIPFTVSQAGNYQLQTSYYQFDCDTVLYLFDQSQTMIAANDDYTDLYSCIIMYLEPGNYYVEIEEINTNPLSCHLEIKQI